MKMFAVVHFHGTEEVEIVSTNWLIDDVNCAWPPFKNNRLKKALLGGELPEEDWEIYSIKIMGKYDTFEKATLKCIQAEETSNLESEVSEDEKKNRKERKRVVFSDSEEENASKLPLPPIIKKSSLINRSNSQRGKKPKLQVQEVPFQIIEDCSPSLISGANTGFASPQAVTSNIEPTEWSQSLSLNTMSQYPLRIVQDEPTSTEKRMLTMMLGIQSTLTEVVSLLNTLARKEANRESPDVSYFSELPLQSLASLREFETSVHTDENFSKAVRQLSHRGGHDVRTATRNVLQCLLIDEVAALFNWAGRGGKEEFKKLKLKSLVLFAVRENFSTKEAMAKDVEDSIKDWLKYAPIRIIRAKKNANSI